MSGSEDKDLAVEIGKRIAYYRHESHLSQTTLAKLVGIRQAPLSNLEKGKCLPSTRVLMKLSQVLHVPADQILGVAISEESLEASSIRSIYGDESCITLCQKWPKTARYHVVSLPHLSFEYNEIEAENIACHLRNVFGCEHIVKLDWCNHLQWEGIHVCEASITSPCAVFMDMVTSESWLFIKSACTFEEKNYYVAYGLARLVIAHRDSIVGENLKSFMSQKDRLARAIALALLMPNALVARYIALEGTSVLEHLNEHLDPLMASFGVRREDLVLRLKMLGML